MEAFSKISFRSEVNSRKGGQEEQPKMLGSIFVRSSELTPTVAID